VSIGSIPRLDPNNRAASLMSQATNEEHFSSNFLFQLTPSFY